MLFKTYEAFQNRLEYTHRADGSWKAEFHGAVNVAVEEPTLERCRYKALEALDQRDALELSRAVMLAGTGRGRRDEALGDVVAHSPWRDVRATRELGQRQPVAVASSVHGPILTLLRSTVNRRSKRRPAAGRFPAPPAR